VSEIEREMTRLRKDLATAKADATTNLLHYHSAVDEAEELRGKLDETQRESSERLEAARWAYGHIFKTHSWFRQHWHTVHTRWPWLEE